MRSLLLLAVLAVSVSLAAAVPNAAVCNADAVQLELRPTNPGFYQLAFIAVDPRASNHKADFIDIHYRVNNEDSVNLRVLTEAAITDFNQRAKQASVDGIELEAGDVLRAYATYAANGIACDTPIHTFNAPESFSPRMNQRMLFNQQSFDIAEEPTMRRRRVTMRPQTLEDEFWTQQAVEAEINHAQGACPAVAYDQDVLKMSGLRDSYVLSFENKTPGKQLNFVDLHVATDSSPEWNNLRLASDMQLDLAHKVMQPGVVVKPNERLSWYWSYRTTSADGITIDCTTPIQTITPQQITHEVDLNQIAQRI